MSKEIIPIERIMQSIRWIRGHDVLLDSDLAALCGVQTKNLNKAVRRNAGRFPADFMFQLTSDKLRTLRFQIGTSKARAGSRYCPHPFTERVGMLSSVLNSEWFGERTRLARWPWRPRHRELFLPFAASVFHTSSSSGFSAGRRKEHPGRVCSPA